MSVAVVGDGDSKDDGNSEGTISNDKVGVVGSDEEVEQAAALLANKMEIPPLQKPAKKAATGMKHQRQATIKEMLANTRKSLDAASGKQPKTKSTSEKKTSWID